MTEQEKKLLLQYICDMLPYGVIVDYTENKYEQPQWKITTIYPDTYEGWIHKETKDGCGSKLSSRQFKIENIKPYIRPMSSMSEKEKDELYTAMDWYGAINENGDIETKGQEKIYRETFCQYINWLKVKHFDYLGLINMGLALEAPKNMYTDSSVFGINNDIVLRQCDFMVGDFIRVRKKTNPNNEYIARVRAITEVIETDIGVCMFGEAYPIQITNEILDGNLLTKNVDLEEWTIPNKKYRIVICNVGSKFKLRIYHQKEQLLNIEVKYVHRLQHLLHEFGSDDVIFEIPLTKK